MKNKEILFMQEGYEMQSTAFQSCILLQTMNEERKKNMRKEEKLLFKELCKFKSVAFDEALLPYATPHVLGQLFFNRMQGIAYDTLKRNNLLGKVNREFRNSLKGAYEQNLEKNRSFFKCVAMVSDILAPCEDKAAMLKGAWLCAHYPEGYRTSNDIDLLVLPKDVTTVGNLLNNAGFRQGNVRNGDFIPATRKEIIESKMMRGETVPYIKEVNLPGMKYLEVDINFSLDYKNGENDLLSNILGRVETKEEKGIKFVTLQKEDFFLHLCAHLYKEATTLPWIEMHRDMTLYKYCDIYMMLSEMFDEEVERLFVRAKELGMQKICGYTVWQTAELFDLRHTRAVQKAKEALSEDPAFLLQVVSPKDKKILVYETQDIVERFFMEDRTQDLREEKER